MSKVTILKNTSFYECWEGVKFRSVINRKIPLGTPPIIKIKHESCPKYFDLLACQFDSVISTFNFITVHNEWKS